MLNEVLNEGREWESYPVQENAGNGVKCLFGVFSCSFDFSENGTFNDSRRIILNDIKSHPTPPMEWSPASITTKIIGSEKLM